MANFPALQIANISVSYGNRSEEFIASQAGDNVAIDYKSIPLGTIIDVSFHLDRTGLHSLFNHYSTQKSSFIGFQFTSATLIEVAVPSGFSWIYSSEPIIDDIVNELAYVRCQFKLVPRGGTLYVPGGSMPIGMRFYASGFVGGGESSGYVTWPIGLRLIFEVNDNTPGAAVFLLKYLQNFSDTIVPTRSFTLNGSPQIIQSGGLNDASHGSFNGSSWIVYDNMPSLTGDLTIETYAIPASISDKVIFSDSQGTNTQGFRQWSDGSLSVYWEGGEIKSSAGLIQVGLLYHYAFSREVTGPGQSLSRLFINGNLVASGSGITATMRVNVIGTMLLAGNVNQGTQYNGKLNETRIKNACIYKTNFTPPAPFPGS